MTLECREYPQEFKEMAAAVLVLSSLKYCIADSEIPQIWKELKHQFPRKIEIPHPILPAVVESQNFPPVAALVGLIREYSKPFEKQLTESDVKDDQSRLSLNKDLVKERLYPLLMKSPNCSRPEETLKIGIPVTVYDSEGKEYEMCFKLWVEKIHVLCSKNWKKFRHDHDLVKHEDWVTVWMFRHKFTKKLCFVVTSRRLDTPNYKSPKRRSNGGGNLINNKRFKLDD